MKKAIKSALLVCFALLVCALTLTACEKEPQETVHTHAFGEWTTVREATCTNVGQEARECACGERETRSIELAAHTEQTIPGVAATKLKEGLTEGVECAVCHKVLVKQEVIPALAPPADVWNGSVATEFAGGSGTESDPYLISTGAQLAYLAKLVNSSADNPSLGQYYKLTNCIDLNGQKWDPIGHYYAKNQYREFQGHFDGDGFEVFNFTITTSSSPYYFGLFGRASNGSIKNLGVTEFTITVTTLDIACVGGLVGRTESDLTNCYASGSITVKGKKDNERTYVNVYVGGLAGWAGCDITNCYSTSFVDARVNVEYGQGKFTGNLLAGGLVGMTNKSEVTNCYATGKVQAVADGKDAYAYIYAGGLIGEDSETGITGCHATGDVSATGSISGYEMALTYAGGLVGNSYATINNCYATGNVSASTSGKNCYDAKTWAGGLTGSAAYKVTNCYATGDVTAKASGGNHCNANCIAGGLIGEAEEAEITNCFATGNITCNVSGIRPWHSAGGFVGFNVQSTLTNFYHYEKQTLTINGDKKNSTADNSCTQEQLNDAAFYTDTLGWNKTLWDFSALDFAKKAFPTLQISTANS